MSPGTSWTYQGVVRWTQENSDRTHETKVTWRTEVKRLIQHGEDRAAIIMGMPTDLDWSAGKPQPSDSLLIETKGNFYRVSGPRYAEMLRHLEQPSDDLSKSLSEDDLFFKWPLKSGEKFSCDSQDPPRDDNMYCWLVESVEPAHLNGIAGTPPAASAFELSFRTNPDDTEYTFVPGVGITSYSYHHHGTVADTELQLTEFHQPSAHAN